MEVRFGLIFGKGTAIMLHHLTFVRVSWRHVCASELSPLECLGASQRLFQCLHEHHLERIHHSWKVLFLQL